MNFTAMIKKKELNEKISPVSLEADSVIDALDNARSGQDTPWIS